MKQLIWISFDLGVRGDFQGIYEFLDAHGAKDCGDSMAAFEYEFKKDLLTELKKDLANKVELDKRSRVYVIYQGKSGKPAGRFILGKRKSPPWTGFGPSEAAGEEEDISA
jgi:hypothetical protein